MLAQHELLASAPVVGQLESSSVRAPGDARRALLASRRDAHARAPTRRSLAPFHETAGAPDHPPSARRRLQLRREAGEQHLDEVGEALVGRRFQLELTCDLEQQKAGERTAEGTRRMDAAGSR